MSFVGDLFGGDDAADAARDAASIQARYQLKALNYLKEREAVPQQFREAALRQLGGVYGLEGGEGDQATFIEGLQGAPLYQALMSGQEAGEEAIMRKAGATGGLRSGNVQSALANYSTQLQNQALLQSYNQQVQGLSGLAMLPSNANQIAQLTGQIGQTKAQGIIGAAQAQQNALQSGVGAISSLGQLGLNAYELFSDVRLKTQIEKIGILGEFNFYQFVWNRFAEKLFNLKGKMNGVLAQEVIKKKPELVSLKEGFLIVDYQKLFAEAQ